MKTPQLHTLLTACLLGGVITQPVRAAEQVLVNWDHVWKYFHPMSDDPVLNDAAIDDTGAGLAPNIGPDLIYPNFNGTTDALGAWFAKESDFIGPSGYATLFGKGFGIDGPNVGDPVNNYSTYDGGSGVGPFGYEAIVYFGRTDISPEVLGFGTPLTQTPANRRFASYYRTTINPIQDFTKPRIRMILDDNAVIYYDGVAVARVNRDNSTITYADIAASDTAATNNEEGLTGTPVPPAPNNGNENTIQSFPLDQAGGPGRATLTAGAKADSFVTIPVPKITAGTHTIAVIVRNQGTNSSDKCFAFQLLGDDAGISAIVNSTTRSTGADVFNPADDTFTASVTVTKLGTPSVEWTSDVAPSVAGPYSYDTAYTFGPFSAAAPVPVTFTATGAPALTAFANLTAPVAPAVLGENQIGGLSAITASVVSPWTQMPGLPADRRIQLNNGSALGGISTDLIALTPGTAKCVTVSLEYNDNSTGSNAETGDSVKVELVTDAGTFNLTAPYDSDGTSNANGSALNGEDDAAQTNGDELNPDSLPEDHTFTARWLLAGVVPAAATTMQIRVSANNDSASETLRLGNIVLKPCVDTDGDGVLDVWEEVAGTNPADPASNFREISHSIVPGAPGTVTITVPSVVDRTYQVYSSAELQIWNRQAPVSLTPPLLFDMNTPGTGANLPLTRTDLSTTRQFWKALVHLPTTDITSP